MSAAGPSENAAHRSSQNALGELEPGASFTSAARTITETDLVSFAALTGDWHPQHSDAEWAREGHFGERVAHGMLVLSYSLGLAPMNPERVIALRGIRDVVFKRPVKIGDTIRVEGRVEHLRPLDEETGIAELTWKVVNQSDETVVRAHLQALWRLEASDPAADALLSAWEAPLDEVFL